MTDTNGWPNEAREAVARAIVQADEQNGGPPWDWVMRQGKHVVGNVYDRADAAMEALAPFVAALVAAGQEAMRAACVQFHLDRLAKSMPPPGQPVSEPMIRGYLQPAWHKTSAELLAALPLPSAPAALARMIAEAEARGMEKAAGIAEACAASLRAIRHLRDADAVGDAAAAVRAYLGMMATAAAKRGDFETFNRLAAEACKVELTAVEAAQEACDGE